MVFLLVFKNLLNLTVACQHKFFHPSDLNQLQLHYFLTSFLNFKAFDAFNRVC